MLKTAILIAALIHFLGFSPISFGEEYRTGGILILRGSARKDLWVPPRDGEEIERTSRRKKSNPISPVSSPAAFPTPFGRATKESLPAREPAEERRFTNSEIARPSPIDQREKDYLSRLARPPISPIGSRIESVNLNREDNPLRYLRQGETIEEVDESSNHALDDESRSEAIPVPNRGFSDAEKSAEKSELITRRPQVTSSATATTSSAENVGHSEINAEAYESNPSPESIPSPAKRIKVDGRDVSSNSTANARSTPDLVVNDKIGPDSWRGQRTSVPAIDEAPSGLVVINWYQLAFLMGGAAFLALFLPWNSSRSLKKLFRHLEPTIRVQMPNTIQVTTNGQITTLDNSRGIALPPANALSPAIENEPTKPTDSDRPLNVVDFSELAADLVPSETFAEAQEKAAEQQRQHEESILAQVLEDNLKLRQSFLASD